MQSNYNPYNYYQLNQYAFVNGIEGAKSYMLQPSQMIMLLDSDEPIIYKKISNSYGQATLECYKMVPITEEELKATKNQVNSEYVSKSDFENFTKKMEEFMKECKKNG